MTIPFDGMTNRTARMIVHWLRINGFCVDGSDGGQWLALVEEAGEFTGAYRRWAGMARRTGSAADLWAECADVVITAYVLAAELGCLLPRRPGPAQSALDRADTVEPDPVAAVLDVSRTVTAVVDSRDDTPRRTAVLLAEVVRAAYRAAAVVRFDLDAAIAAKLTIVFARGWRESTGPRPTLAATRSGMERVAQTGGDR